MNNKMIFFVLFFFIFSNKVISQDTIRLNKKPKVILKSWYPEYKNFPKLKIGEGKILFTIIPGSNYLDRNNIDRNDIDLRTTNSQTKIEETIKENQYWVIVNPTDAKFIEFQVWLDLENTIILIKDNGKWKNATELYESDSNRILIDKVKLVVEK
jgi:hypothetical protein